MLRLIFVLLLSLSFSLAANKFESSFYALSSLHFFMEEMQRASDEKSIAITNEELDILWQKALTCEPAGQKIASAKQAYGEGNLLFAEQLLKNAWRKAKREIFKEYSRLSDPCKSLKNSYPNFDDNPLFTPSMRMRMRKHLLPLTHPAKASLDRLFLHARPTSNEESLLSAGFEIIISPRNSFIKVAKHLSLKGFLLKLYLDTELRKKLNLPGWLWLLQRCEGAKDVRRLIAKKKIQYFTVPNKWLYPLPEDPFYPKSLSTQHEVILLVQDMNLAPREESFKAWKCKVTKKHLKELYCVISHGFASAALADNVPYCKNGKFAFVDTEYPKRTPKYHHAKKYLSPEMLKYWEHLVRSGGADS